MASSKQQSFSTWEYVEIPQQEAKKIEIGQFRNDPVYRIKFREDLSKEKSLLPLYVFSYDERIKTHQLMNQ